MLEAFGKLHLNPKAISQMKVALEKVWDNLPQVQPT